MVSVIGGGDNTVDTYVHQRMRYPGGNAVNVAVLAGRYGAQAAYLGWLGDDERGRLLLTALEAEGLDVSHCRVLPDVPTAFSEVELVDGDRVFGPSDTGACARIDLTEADLDYLRGFDVVHSSVFSHLEGQMERLKSGSHCLAFDLSQRCDGPYLEAVLPHVDFAFLSAADLPYGDQEDLARRMLALGPTWVVITRGKEGAWAYNGRGVYHQGILPVEAVDTLGAGDAFAARFLVEIAAGQPVRPALLAAAQSAAENCTHFGAFGYGQSY